MDATQATGADRGGAALAGRSVLVTGANGGIGLGMAMALGDAGARVILWGRDQTKNEQAGSLLRQRGIEAHVVACDVADEQQVTDAFAASVEAVGGRIDSVFANAGVSGDGTAFVDLSLNQWQQVTQTNLDGTFLTLREAARHMIPAGGGALVAVSSTSAMHGAAGNEAYGASKTGILGLVRALAVGLARHHIRVNALVPGWTRTDMNTSLFENDRFRTATTQRTPVRRWASADEMGPPAVFLADPTTTFHTGDCVVVDGGYTVF